MPGQVEFRPGQIVYHAESDRYATVIETKSYYTRIKGKIGKVGLPTGGPRHYSKRIYPQSVFQKHLLGLNVHSAIMDEANFMGKTKISQYLSIKWLDGRWSDATWDAKHFVVRHPLEALAECAD